MNDMHKNGSKILLCISVAILFHIGLIWCVYVGFLWWLSAVAMLLLLLVPLDLIGKKNMFIHYLTIAFSVISPPTAALLPWISS